MFHETPTTVEIPCGDQLSSIDVGWNQYLLTKKSVVQEKNLAGMECWQKTRRGPNIQVIDIVIVAKCNY